MSYVVVVPADQTIAFVTADGEVTTKHSKANFWNTRVEADTALQRYNDSIPSSVKINGVTHDLTREHYFGWVAEVSDEREFRSREDTW